ncbi:hypothetical protein HY346_02360 [Candidatus Microgenomates bacterium]|nr:hypothetical protein [Candidatus Microgenomates bacterium]
MGDANNITYQDIKKAVETKDGKGQTADQAIQNLKDTWPLVKDDDKQYQTGNDQSADDGDDHQAPVASTDQPD